MHRQLHSRGEALPTGFALVRPLPRVSARMHQQGPGATEGHTTRAAQVRLLFLMHPEVHRAWIQLREFLVAKSAGIRALAGVNAHVRLQNRVRQEPLVTVRARKRPLSAVTSQMNCKQSLRAEPLLTKAASEGQDFRFRVNKEMLVQVFLTFIGLVALGALEWPHRRVNDVMFFQGGARCKSLATLQAGVFTGSGGGLADSGSACCQGPDPALF